MKPIVTAVHPGNHTLRWSWLAGNEINFQLPFDRNEKAATPNAAAFKNLVSDLFQCLFTAAIHKNSLATYPL